MQSLKVWKKNWGNTNKRGARRRIRRDRDAEGIEGGERSEEGANKGLGSVVSSPSGVWGGAPAEIEFGVFWP